MFRTVPLHCVPFKVFILSLMCYPHVQYKATASLHSPGRPFPSPALPSIPLPLNPFLSSLSSVHLPSSPFSSIPLSLTPFLSSITASLSLCSSPFFSFSSPASPYLSLTPLSFPYSFPISLFLSLLPLLSPASLYISLLPSLPPLTVSHFSPPPSLPSLPLQSSTLSPLLSFPLPMSPYPQYIFPFISLPDLT